MDIVKQTLKNLGITVRSIYPTGSRYTCNPPVMDTDQDYLVLVNDFNFAYNTLCANWEDCMPPGTQEATDNYQDEKFYGIVWNAFRLGDINIMVSENVDWYHASVAATELCKAWNVQDKAKRIRLFRNLKYREPLEEGDLPC